MSIDELGRAAAAEARRAAASGVNAMTMLNEFHRRRRIRTAGAIGLAVAVCAAIAVGVVLAQPGKSSSTLPGHTEPTLPDTSSSSGTPLVPVVVRLPVPVTIHAPANFVQYANQFGTSCAESYREDVNGTGVTIMEKAMPVRDDGSWSRDASAGTTAASMAQWLSARPFLTHTSVKQVYVDGIAGGWRVSGELKASAKLLADKEGVSVAPTFADDFCKAGFAPNLYGSYTLYDLPHAGVTVIWSWTTQPDHGLVDDDQPFVDGLRFG